MSPGSSTRRQIAVLSGCVSLAVLGCASPAASPEELAREEARLLQPFTSEQILVASEVELTLTANFYERVAQRVNTNVHEMKRRPTDDGGMSYEFTATVPGVAPMVFQIERTRIVVEQRMVMNVLGGRQRLTLDASARTVTLQSTDGTTQLREVEVRDGVLQRSP